MKVLNGIAVIIIVLVVSFWLGIKLTMISIPIGHVGVRIQEYGILGKKGVVPEDFGPGWHRDFGPIDTWVLFDSTVQTLEMTRDMEYGSVMGRDDVRVQSADGYAVSVDVTVKYRIMKGKAHNLYQDTGSGIKYKTIVRNEAQRACMAFLGQMKTEEFYNPEQRRLTAEQVKLWLIESLADNYVEVIEVLFRDVQFDPEYENKIRRKKLADQEVELNKSMGRAAEMRGKTQVIQAQTKKLTDIIIQEKEAEMIKMEAQANLEIAQINAEAEKYSIQRRADADLIDAQKRAEGELLVLQSKAEGERLRNEAMQGTGGDKIVALEAAKNLNLSEATISTLDVDLLDVNKMATKFGVKEKE